MSIFVPLAMFGWIPLGLWIFKTYQGRTAVICGFLIAWLFLPMYDYELPGLPNYSKISALSYIMMLGVVLYDRERLQKLAFNLLDLPVILFCCGSFFSSVSNGLGAYDGLSAMMGKLTVWFIPYVLGRMYFGDLTAMRDLTTGLFIGGLLYVPFCMFEVIMSPRLHKIIYGFHPHIFGQSRRWGGWRPVVFMQHGLMVGMWMTTASLAGIQLMRHRQLGWVKRIFNVPPVLVIGGLIVVTVLCKSTGALALLLFGWAALYAGSRFRTRLVFIILLLLPCLYVSTRATGIWTGENFIEFLSTRMPDDRVGSLEFRFVNENILMDKAFGRPLFGWGGWKRSFVFDSRGMPTSVPDGLWILVLGQNGWWGLLTMYLTLAIPQLIYLIKFPPETWTTDPFISIGLVLLVLMSLFTIDSLLNDMYNPLIMLVAGGITSLALVPISQLTRPHNTDPVFKEEPTARPRLI